MSACAIDHLVVTAPSLAAGARYVRDALGVDLQPGGEHPRMGTHNRLLKLGLATYLEVIAVNPAAPDPGRPRWFGLDDGEPDAAPRLATWVLRSDDIHASVAAANEPLGSIERMQRGALQWQITIPADGRPAWDGVAPSIIEWPQGAHPASRLDEAGCRLIGIELFHPDASRVSALLSRLGFAGALRVTALPAGTRGYVLAHIDTPQGARVLATPGDGRTEP